MQKQEFPTNSLGDFIIIILIIIIIIILIIIIIRRRNGAKTRSPQSFAW